MGIHGTSDSTGGNQMPDEEEIENIGSSDEDEAAEADAYCDYNCDDCESRIPPGLQTPGGSDCSKGLK
jgi:hypothetical protein